MPPRRGGGKPKRRVAIITSRAVSLKNVARDIAHAAKTQGITPVLLDYQPDPFSLAGMAEQAIIVMTVDPLTSRSWLLLNRELMRLGVPSFVYSTVEGRLPQIFFKDWMKREPVYVANSRYTASKLEEVGVNVYDVVPHAVNLEEARLARNYVRATRKLIAERVNAKFIVGIVAQNHPRKGLDRAAMVAEAVLGETDDIGFYVVTTPDGAGHFRGLKNTYVDTDYGKRGRVETLALIGSFDLLLHPSLSEGFGLPVLEAMAMGVPSVHAAYEPLIEFSPSDLNFWVPYDEIVYDSFGEGIEYELHVYDPARMAKEVLRAYDEAVNRPDDWQARKKALERLVAERYGVDTVYPRLFQLLDDMEELAE